MVFLYISIVKFILALKLELSKPQLNHVFTLVHGIILCTGRKDITQIRNATRQDLHLSSITNFLNHSLWCVNRMQFALEMRRSAFSNYMKVESLSGATALSLLIWRVKDAHTLGIIVHITQKSIVRPVNT
ncbi:hypothetical protein GK047_26160 [Paenibacillus sp. SYP-B3998]|uniref:Uncharacterized protein n=1 Tax=Paenibacillus sp. SYP-B3998 TaxID=2678564 RepID=A0A6G4A6I1_9BACL|nr:hypothetical protein [Paenibacillus sp. SYP-B3998]NEW09431.1 hypothetical protein [Paenibacillus sp. SYP-B3998]